MCTLAAVRRACLSLALVAALAAGGCGGDDKPKVESKADFVAVADAICVKRDRRSTELQRRQISTDNELAKLSGELAGIYADAVKELQAVPLPPGDARPGAQKYAAATAALRTPVQQMKVASKDLEAATETRKPAAVKAAGRKLQISVTTVQSLGEVADQAARTYGMRNCGRAATPDPVS